MFALILFLEKSEERLSDSLKATQQWWSEEWGLLLFLLCVKGQVLTEKGTNRTVEVLDFFFFLIHPEH
jgi:hypothetical protein